MLEYFDKLQAVGGGVGEKKKAINKMFRKKNYVRTTIRQAFILNGRTDVILIVSLL